MAKLFGPGDIDACSMWPSLYRRTSFPRGVSMYCATRVIDEEARARGAVEAFGDGAFGGGVGKAEPVDAAVDAPLPLSPAGSLRTI